MFLNHIDCFLFVALSCTEEHVKPSVQHYGIFDLFLFFTVLADIFFANYSVDIFLTSTNESMSFGLIHIKPTLCFLC